MPKLTLLIPILMLICTSVQASEIERPEDLEGRLTLSAFDYHGADPSTWTPVLGDQLEEFFSHGWFGGVYIEEKPLLGQWHSILLLGRKGKHFTLQGLGGQLDRGELTIKEDRYCVRWKVFGSLCYKVMAGKLAGKPVHLITRESGKIWGGIELLVESGEPKKVTKQVEILELFDATASVAGDAREKIYNQLMAQLLNDIVPNTGQKFAYRSFEINKTLAVCIDWNGSNPNDIFYGGSWGAFGYEWTDESKREAMRTCQSEYESRGCQCQVVDQNDKNVLQVPHDFLALHSGSGSSRSTQTDSSICNFALSTAGGVPQWDDRGAIRNSVNEAKRRGLTPEVCAKLLGVQTVQVKEPPPKEGNIEERLTKLKSLYDKGLITKEEYENKQAEILEGL